MSNKLIILAILFLANSNIQSQSLKAYLKAAQEAIDNKDYYSAMEFNKTALEFDDNQPDVWYNLAESARMYSAFNTAEQYYEKISKSEYNINYPLADYWLGVVKRDLGKYSEASAIFRKFLIDKPQVESSIIAKAKSELQSTEWAMNLDRNKDVGANVQLLGNQVNTSFSDFAPYLIGDTLFYSSFNYYSEVDKNKRVSKILSAEGENKGVLLDDKFNDPELHTANISFSPNMNKVFYTVCENKNESELICEIYYREKQGNGQWGAEKKLPNSVNQAGYSTTHPNITSVNGKEVLFFSSNRPGSKGLFDIWMSEIVDGNQFQDAVNLSEINTENNEYTPFYHIKSNALYFSNDGGYNGLGGLDIFKTYNNAGKWSAVENIGLPINSSYNDLYYFLNDDESLAYFASNRAGSKFIDEEKKVCCNDIYKVSFSGLDLVVYTFDKTTNQALTGVKIELMELPEVNTPLNSKIDDNDNKFDFSIQKIKKYRLIATKDGYTSDTVDFDTYNTDTKEIIQKLYLKPEKIILQAFTFNKEDNNPLMNTTVKLIDKATNKVVERSNTSGNDYSFDIDPNKEYILIATKPGYSPDTLTFNTTNLKAGTLRKELHLKPFRALSRLADYLPLPLYFDNDEPDPRTRKDKTNLTYEQTYRKYYARKDLFVTNFIKPLTDGERNDAQSDLDFFFENKVRGGFESLNGFSDYLLDYLSKGERVEIMIRGYTSPRSQSDYNENLGHRRVSSVDNYFRLFRGGAFVPYINSGKLVITEVSLGETAAASDVIDDIKDERNSIYSVKASKERRVEIIDVNSLKK
ncbi:MAG: hypothetical protein KBA06_04185 [Saprospiraceae bacterium]|nr:hypothetical protein [Saprospiraceae bacterium]